MPSAPNGPSDNQDQPLGYGGYPATSGMMEGGEGMAVHRSISDYVIILRERIWYIVGISLLFFLAVVVFTFTRTKTYDATSTLQILRRDMSVMQGQGVVDSEVRSAEDLNTQVKVLESQILLTKVVTHLTATEKNHLLEKAREKGPILDEQATLEAILEKNREITPFRLSLLISLTYRDSDPQLAAKISNLLADEYLKYNSTTRVDESVKAVDELSIRADEQKKKVEDMARRVQAYREKNNLISLDQRKDIATEKLKALNLYVTQATQKLSDATVRWTQVKEMKGDTDALLNLNFISSQPGIGGQDGLLQRVAVAKIAVAKMSERYRAKHPSMIQAMNELKQTQQELARAVKNAASSAESDYQTAERNAKEARLALAAQEEESLKLDRYAVEFNNLTRDADINEKLLQNMISRMQETNVTGTIQSQNARVVDRAQPPSKPSYPRTILFLALGAIGGLGLGVGVAFLIAMIDDRIKSSYDIESVVGIPLVGIIPQIKSSEITERAHISLNQAEPQVTESFLSLHAALKVKEQSQREQCILITSTAPSEGKSMIIANLAAMCGANGEKTVLVDCDLRKPVQHRYHGVQNKKGVADYCKEGLSLEEVTNKSVDPNVDLITVGTYTRNPTQVLSSKEFKKMVAELREKYDRVFFDTPPVAVVSDSLLLLPLADAFLYTIFFNRIRRKTAKYCVRKVLETNVPCLGAVLNGLDLKRADYYYSHYYNKSYQKYYSNTGPDEA